jgi:hypothetical protein
MAPNNVELLNLRVTHFLSDDANDRAYRGRLEPVIGVDVAGECDAGSPGSDGASPYPRREQVDAGFIARAVVRNGRLRTNAGLE